ncbi:hypothetical protein AC529_09060, partial [Thermobifida cellulosilytica TB100]
PAEPVPGGYGPSSYDTGSFGSYDTGSHTRADYPPTPPGGAQPYPAYPDLLGDYPRQPPAPPGGYGEPGYDQPGQWQPPGPGGRFDEDPDGYRYR